MSTMTGHHMNCDEFASRLADYLEGDAPEAVRAAMTTHAAVCDGCGELLADLEALPHEAAALPLLEPSRDLWAGIAERIDARVLPLDAPRVSRMVTARRGWLRPAAAAAALMLVTAGVTYKLTKMMTPIVPDVASFTPTPDAAVPVQVAAITTKDSTPTGATADAPTTSPTTSPATRVASSGNRGRTNGSTARLVASTRTPAEERSLPSSTARLVRNDPLREAEPVYDREISKLRTIVRQRRGQLDPATVAVLEQSIAVIDSAIAQSRAALAKDPASGFLATQLNHSLEKKVELLRTAALLPSRT
jgi:hypothetical protein